MVPDVDIVYLPADDGSRAIAAHGASAVLVLGAPAEHLRQASSAAGVDLRTGDPGNWGAILKVGSYSVRFEGGCAALVVLAGNPATTVEAAKKRDASHHLGVADSLFPTLWPGAAAVASGCSLAIDDIVRVKATGELGRVQEVVLRGANYQVTVATASARPKVGEDAVEKLDGDPRDPSFWLSQTPASAEEIALTISWTKLRNALTDTVYSFAATKTLFRPYQFLPVLKLLNTGSDRLLIADEVGLGKTIEAGLIWAELEQRAQVDRVLVVCPSALTLKWRAEMGRRFDYDLELLKPAQLRDFAEAIADGRDPSLTGVISLESLRVADDVLERLAEVAPRFDLVIVDEAHALRNRGRKSHTLGQLLADWADVMVFLSATPLNLGQSDLFNLVNLLREGEFFDEGVFALQIEPNAVLNEIARALKPGVRPKALIAKLEKIQRMTLGDPVASRPAYASLRSLLSRDTPFDEKERAKARRLVAELNTLGSVLTRTRKADVPDAKAVRQAEEIEVKWTDDEREVYDGIYSRFMQEYTARGVPPGFGMQMPLRQAASCLPAMQKALRADSYSLTDQIDDFDLDEDISELGAELDLQLGSMASLLRPLPIDSKYDALLERLLRARRNGMKQVMIFSFFRGTLSYLDERLSEHFTTKVMTGGTKVPVRQEIMEAFRRGEFEVLLLSQVGSEGLDFEFCNVLVNYDLPWNPMQVEQRIGRIDRFGQTSEKIFIFNMHVPGTIESDIFDRLYNRIGLFESSIGELEPILRSELKQITASVLDPRLTAAQRSAETDRIAVALAKRAEEIRDLEQSRGALAAVDQLEIDGMTDNGPSNGRYVGPTEVRRLVETVVTSSGGKLSKPDSDGVCKLIGTDKLARALASTPRRRGGGVRTKQELAASFRDGDIVRVTFDNAVASKHDVELLSARHLLIDVALRSLDESRLSLHRYGSVAVPGAPPGRSFAVQIDLVHSSGLTPRVEFWATAVDLHTGQRDDAVGEQVLVALAEGELRDGPASDSALFQRRVEELAALAYDRQRVTEAIWRAENESLVEARIASQIQSLTLKIGHAEANLSNVEGSRRSESILRLHRGRLRNLHAQRDEIRPRLERLKELHVALTPVVLVQVTGPN